MIIKIMKSYIIKKTQKSITLKRDKSLQSQDTLRASSIMERGSQMSNSRTIQAIKLKHHSKSLSRHLASPYDNFVKQLKIKLPTPKEKFIQFLKIQPFNRIQNHNQLIALFLKNVAFFKIHQTAVVINLAKKVKLVEKDEIDQKMMVIVLEGTCHYNDESYSAGRLINRKPINPKSLRPDFSTKLLGINRHEYLSFVSEYIRQEIFKIKQFVNGIQMFKMFSEKTLQKFTSSMSLHYYLRGEKLYRVGDDADFLYVIFSGKVSRKVVIQIEKINKIPSGKFEKEVRILSKSYSHQIEFFKQDLVGVTQIIEGVHFRKQQIDVDEDTILLGVQRSIIEETLDDYVIDRFKKYNLKKYPSNYDELCSNYQKEKTELRRSEERKISALQNELKIMQNDRRKQKIESIIKMYETNIKLVDSKNLLSKKLHFEVDFGK